jgi:hypothetical protein
VRVGLRHKARGMLRLLRRLREKEAAQEVQKIGEIEMMEKGDDEVLDQSERYYEQEEVKYLQENNNNKNSHAAKSTLNL